MARRILAAFRVGYTRVRLDVQMIIQQALEHHRAGRLPQAEQLYRAVLLHDPDNADALGLLGVIASQAGHHEDAINLLRRSIAARASATMMMNLASALQAAGRIDEALAACRDALALQPDFMPALAAQGALLKRLGRLDEADACAREMVRLAPHAHAPHANLGIVLAESGNFAQGLAHVRRSVEINPEYAHGWSVLGAMLQQQGVLDEAEIAQRRAIVLQPAEPSHLAGLGSNLLEQGRVHNAFEAYQQASKLAPADPQLGSNILMAAQYLPDVDARALHRLHVDWAARHADSLTAKAAPHANDRSPQRQLRIGYLSPHFCDHVIGRYIAPVLAAHDHARFEIFCYFDSAFEDAVTGQLRAAADTWRTTGTLDDPHLAQLIRDDRIDILIDLALHTRANRLTTLARRPAPVQATYLAYPGTSGMRAIDYAFTDPHLDPPDMTGTFHTEQLLRPSDNYWCYPPPADAPEPGQLPASSREYVTFGALNNVCKLNEGGLRLWGQILLRVPNSRLALLIKGNPRHNLYVQKLLADCGIAADRVDLLPQRPMHEYLALYNQIDISLDPFPYNGHTTSLDSLWMGVPVVTLAGDRSVGRAGVSILKNVGLPELIARTADEYIEIAIALAADRVRLASLRATLRDRLRQSPLLDYTKFTRNLESAYREMWKSWCAAGG